MPKQLEFFSDLESRNQKNYTRLPNGRFCNRHQREIAERDRKIARLEKRNQILERQSCALAKANTILQQHAGVNIYHNFT